MIPAAVIPSACGAWVRGGQEQGQEEAEEQEEEEQEEQARRKRRKHRKQTRMKRGREGGGAGALRMVMQLMQERDAGRTGAGRGQNEEEKRWQQQQPRKAPPASSVVYPNALGTRLTASCTPRLHIHPPSSPSTHCNQTSQIRI